MTVTDHLGRLRKKAWQYKTATTYSDSETFSPRRLALLPYGISRTVRLSAQIVAVIIRANTPH